LVDDGAFTADLFDQPEVGEALARQYDTRVASAFGCSAIGSCGYRVHSPAGTRSVVVDVDGVVEDEGEPLPGEVTDDIDQHDMYSVLDTLALLELDVEEGVESSTRCAVLRLAPKRGRRPGSKGTPNPAL
jgi:hypothetical protein